MDKYGERFIPTVQKDGFIINDTLFNVVDGGSHIAMAKTAGLTALEFANSLHKLNPDIVLIRGDRFEQLAIAMVAAYLNKTIAHIEGGDVSGTIDESVRHAITKLSHIHFVTNEDSRRRVIQMGENPRRVFNVGSLDVEAASLVNKKLDNRFINSVGTGGKIDINKPFAIVLYHPVTTEKNNRKHGAIVLKAIDELNIPTIWFWPNNDAGTNDVVKAIRVHREREKLKNDKMRFITNLSPDDFIALLKQSNVLIGNSSAGIKESSYIGTPVVNIGTRQRDRLRGPNVIDVACNYDAIKKAVKEQFSHGKYPRSDIYYKPHSSRKVAEVLQKTPLYCQKTFNNL